MKNLLLVCVFIVSAACSAAAGLKEKILLVKKTDRKKVETYSLMSTEEYKAEEKEIKAEARLHMKAMSAAEKEWRSSEDLGKKSFPRGAIAVRTIRVITTYTDDEQANKKLAYYMEKDSRLADKKAQRDKGRKTGQRDRDREARAQAREDAREVLYEQARQLYDNKLAELAQGAAAGDAGGGE